MRGKSSSEQGLVVPELYAFTAPGQGGTMTVPGLNFNLMDQLTFYGSYHTRGWNQAIHFVFVPLIHWTITVWLAYAPLPTSFDLPAHLDFLQPAISR